MLTIQTLIAAGAAPTQARVFAAPLAEACERYAINTRPRVASFLAQVMHESARLTSTEEGLWYRKPERIRQIWPARVPSLAAAARLINNPQGLANVVYADRMGNGNEASGDGWRYRGRGLIQLTGRANYTAAAQAIGRDYIRRPELVALPGDACTTAAWFFATAGCLKYADNSDVLGVTKFINPALAGLEDRRDLFDAALEAVA